jgi:signal transduction histidine kinase
MNFISNSIKFTEDGTIDVILFEDIELIKIGCLRLSVRDTGEGIDEEK